MSFQLEGSYVALVTPFKNGAIDEAKLKWLVDWQIEKGINGIVACGTTGETPAMSDDEQDFVIKAIVDAAKGRIPVIAGTGTNNTRHTIERTAHAARMGAEGALVVSPYYNKPTQEGLYQHFRAVAESTKLPVILYNIQSRCGVNIETPTLARLAKDCANIIGVKEASGSLDQMTSVAVNCGPDFIMMSGDDGMTLPCMSVGGRGVISVIANLVPDKVVSLTKAALANDLEEARKIHHYLYPLSKAAFYESNPIPIKEAMAMAGLIEPEFRLPLCRMGDENRERLRAVMEKYDFCVRGNGRTVHAA